MLRLTEVETSALVQAGNPWQNGSPRGDSGGRMAEIIERFRWMQTAPLRGFTTSNVSLEISDLVPGLQALAHNAKVEFFHLNKGLVHVQQNFTRDLLLLEDVAVLGINT